MSFSRRQFIQTGLLASSSLLPIIASANKSLSDYTRRYITGSPNCSNTLNAVTSLGPEIRRYLFAYFDTDQIHCDRRLYLNGPPVAENQYEVPIRVFGELPDVDAVALFAEKNVDPLISIFQFNKRASFPIRTHIQMEKTGYVLAIVRSRKKLFGIRRLIKTGPFCRGGGG